MGHVLIYTIGDVQTHFRRRSGAHVMHPMGLDSFGLPAENAAIREGGHPREIVERNIANIAAQMRRIGWAIDWIARSPTHDPGLLPLDPVAVPALPRARPRLQEEGGGQLVPERQDGAGQRAGDRTGAASAAARRSSQRSWSSGSSASPTTRDGCWTTSS